MKLIIILALALLTGCASVKPTIKCALATGKAEVHQGVMGVGVGQDLADADPLCAALKPKP